LVDRPVPDALGYLLAALESSGRTIPEQRLNGIRSIARAHTDDYDLIVATTLDENVELGEGRDTNATFRAAVNRQIASLISEFRPDALRLTFHNREEIAAEVCARLLRARS
jgi:acetoin utilization deacetylase AcuC-like enzyme